MAEKQESIRNLLLDIRSMLRWFFSGEGAIVTLTILVIAGVLGFLIQDAIQRQRYLELLELELRANYNAANTEVKDVNNHKYLYFHNPLQTSVYYAGLQQGYIITLDPNTQAQLYTLYTQYFPVINNLNKKSMDIIDEYELKWEHCALDNLSSQTACSQEHNQYLSIQKLYSGYIASADVQVWQHIQNVNFNPTEERLHPNNLEGLLLRLFMGNKSLKIQQ